MSINTTNYPVLNAINTNAKTAFDAGRSTVKAFAAFTVKDGVITVSASKKRLADAAAIGVSETTFRTYCDNIKALYFDSVHLSHTISDKDKTAEKKVRDFMYQDICALIHSITDATFSPADINLDGEYARDFMERCVAQLEKFVAGADSYDVEAVKIATFAKWIEGYFSAKLSGVAMLSFAERDRRANLRKFSAKVTKLEKSIQNKDKEIADKESAIAKATEKGKDTKTLEKALTNLNAEALTLKENLTTAKAKKEYYETLSTDYTADELPVNATTETTAA